MLSSFTCEIIELEDTEAEARLPELTSIVIDAVEGGASVSFMMPFIHTEALAYWHGIVPAVASGRVLLAALLDGQAVGTVQLCLATPPNQPHRAEVAKLLVHRTARGHGIGRALMERLEDVARRHSRMLLTLDTLTGGVAEQLIFSLGYVLAGIIPKYARLPSGSLKDTSIFYKQLHYDPINIEPPQLERLS